MLDKTNFRTVLGHYASGLTVVGALVNELPIGFTCQSFHSVSLDPPLVSFNVMRTSSSWPAIRERGRFSISVLSERQSIVSSSLAGKGDDKWALIPWSRTPGDNPVIDGCLVWFDCELFDEHGAGDHVLVLARVVAMQQPDSVPSLPPLVFFRGQYCSIGPIGPES